MALKVYTTLTRKKELFKPIKDKIVGLYTCGPTVYWYAHIGNLRTYIFADVLKRNLRYNGYKVKHVMNITDVGHMTSDADTGEEKMELAARRERKSAWEIAKFYEKKFLEDSAKLNIIKPDIISRATEHIKEQIELIQKLEKKGFTYIIDDGVYFDTSKVKNYGKLAKLNIKGLRAGARIEMVPGKRSITDFALWKFSPTGKKRDMEWDSPWGKGFPGWHIECSAMSMKYLGEHFDVHTGGIDHIPVHHTNEIAQSESATGKKFVNYWLHGAFLELKEARMGKSEGNVILVDNLMEEGFNPLAYRYLVLTAHYRSPLIFSRDALKSAQNAYARLKNIIANLKDDKKINKKYLTEFDKAINDDLNTPQALAALWNLLRDAKAIGKVRTITKMDKVFGLDLLKKEKKGKISEQIKKLIKQREDARKNKDFKTADKIRTQLAEKGIILEDLPEGGTRWKVIK